MARTVILPLAAGALLSLGCSGRDATPATPPPFENPPPPTDPPPSDPTAADPAAADPAAELPSYDDLLRPLEQRTNPPIPELNVTPEGRCFVTFRDPRRPPEPARLGEPPSERPRGTEVQCPPGTELPAGERRAPPTPDAQD